MKNNDHVTTALVIVVTERDGKVKAELYLFANKEEKPEGSAKRGERHKGDRRIGTG